MITVDALLRELARARIGTTFNPDGQRGRGDVGGAPQIRLANLRHYLAERAGADVLAVGEAAGYQGMRWSGIAFTGERILLGWGLPYRKTSSHPKGWSEPSGSIVHGVLAERVAERRVVLWNVVPTHPHRPGNPLSNRRPTAAEQAEGAVFLRPLVELMQPRRLLAVGRVAEAALRGRWDHVYLRHPANAGKAAFREGMLRALAGVSG